MGRPTFGSLFSGIGGLDLGLERAGWECRWQVEIDDYCRRVLAKHWPDVPKFGDIRTVTGGELERVDLICGGFPCQDISNAGKRAGIDGQRSGLWDEYIRLVRVVRPGLVLVENVAALLGRGLGRVLGDLAESGYDAEWDCLPASVVGAPHLRDRVFVTARRAPDDPLLGRRDEHHGGIAARPHRDRAHHGLSRASGARQAVADPERQSLAFGQGAGGERPQPATAGGGWWTTEPDVGRVAHGVPARVDRLGGLGNAVVPQVAEWLGWRLLEVADVG
jgi:DNA (cytosine-5)-methyltransferase 1